MKFFPFLKKKIKDAVILHLSLSLWQVAVGLLE